MSMVRFAYVCDLCGKRQEEYGSCSTCTECNRDVCLSCLHSVTREADGEWIGDPPELHGNGDEGICKKCYIERARSYGGQIENRLMGGELRHYQEEAVDFVLSRRRCLIALDMGTGKSAVALHAVARIGAYPCVIVCPAYIKPTWKQQIEQWTSASFQIIDSLSELEKDKQIYVLNYDVLEKFYNRLKNKGIQAVILDESQFVKNKKANRSRLCKSLVLGVPNRILLTGTPIESRPSELVSQLNILDRVKEFGGEWMFKKRYAIRVHHTGTLTCPHEACIDKRKKAYLPKACCYQCAGWASCYCGHTKWGYWDFNGASNLEELNKRLRSSCMFRKTKAEVGLDLPEFERQVIYLERDNQSEYELAERDFIKWMIDNEGADAALRAYRAEAIVKMERLKLLAVQGKAKSALDWIRDYFESRQKLVVFTWHIEVLRNLVRAFDGIIPAWGIEGAVEIDRRQEILAEFAAASGPALLVANIKAGGLGIDLTCASTCVFLELAWTPTAHDQAESRLHRFGQANPVTAFYLLSEGTIEETIYRKLQKKRQIIRAAIDGGTMALDVDIEREIANELEAGISSSRTIKTQEAK